jgi:two-component system OmpR family response regulator
MRILLVEDDTETADYVTQGLREAGHAITVARDGREGLFQASGQEWDLMVVDRMLPGLDGLALVKSLRQSGRDVPVVFLTALGGVEDRVTGLEGGGDDYLAKPFAFVELLARLQAIVRRRNTSEPATLLRVSDLELDRLKRIVRRAGREIILQSLEFTLLECLMLHAGEVITRTMLLKDVWGYDFDPQTNVVDVHVSRLRTKLDAGGATPLVHTVRGAGYTLRAS